MSIKSNVIIKSNIYVNKSKSKEDKDFLQHVRGYDAISKIPFRLRTDRQQNEFMYAGDFYCPNDKSGDKIRGTLYKNGATISIIKCDQRQCTEYQKCSKWSSFKQFERKTEEAILDESQYIAPDFSLLRYLDADDKVIYLKTTEQSKKKFSSADISITPSIPETPPLPEIEKKADLIPSEAKQNAREKAEPQPYLPEEFPKSDKKKDSFPVKIEYIRISDPREIIEAGIEDRIIVNAGPGTGKTYSLIKRLGYIINNKLVDLQNVLVLCYSRSAVSIIKKRINHEIEAGFLPVEARQLFDGIRTFDSLVTYMLSDVEIDGTINSLDYDERIERFINEVTNQEDCFDWLEYLIVDEMQDLVGARASMVKAILEHIDCGFLLLGDMCQSIYDYQIKDDNELNSYRYYKWLNSTYGADVKRFELTKNVRQKEELAIISEYLRQAILSDDSKKQSEALDLCVDTLGMGNNVGNVRDLGIFNINKSTAILCRNNAEVSIISSELYANDIPHRIMKRAQHIDLVSWIAEILSTYTDNRIGWSAFKDRVTFAGYKDADYKWKLLKSVANDEDDRVLDIRLLAKLLVSGKDLPIELDMASAEAATLSTIHRSKGREYESVILRSEDYIRNDNILDEIKVAYVALTRGKEKISFCEIPQNYIKQLDSKRWIATGRSRKSTKFHCRNIEIGHDEDINPYSFVHKNIDDAIERQKYISKLKPGDMLDAWLIDRTFKLFHNGVYIGMLSDKIFHELRDAMGKTNQSPNLPNHLSGIYVNNIVTIANTRFNDVIAEPYNKSGLWLGVEVSGFAKTDWS